MILEYRPALTAMSGPLEIYTEAGERLCTAESVAELAGCKVASLDVNVSSGQMPAPLGTIGHTRVWSIADVDAWLAPRDCNQAPADLGDRAPADLGDQVPADQVPAELGDQVPAKLRALRRWTRHDHKRPIMTNGQPAWVMDPPTWTTYAQAKASTTGDGLSFVLDGDGIVVLDLSHCVIDGVLTPGARAILDLLPGTYAELSLSGHGVHVFCYANVEKGRRFSSHGVTIQVCGTGRFLTVTGNRLPGRPSVLAEHGTVVHALLGDA
jgi:predicted DNA-binding transcriptional regulator AlpA